MWIRCALCCLRLMRFGTWAAGAVWLCTPCCCFPSAHMRSFILVIANLSRPIQIPLQAPVCALHQLSAPSRCVFWRMRRQCSPRSAAAAVHAALGADACLHSFCPHQCGLCLHFGVGYVVLSTHRLCSASSFCPRCALGIGRW